MRYGLFAILLLLAAPLAQAQEMYRWVDEDGTVHYSDQEVEGAERVELRDVQTYRARDSIQGAEPRARDRSEPAESPAEAPGYDTFRIAAPENDSVVWATGGEMSVTIELEPGLHPGHQVVLFLNGEAVDGTPVASTNIGFSGVIRGTHTLHATVVDADGRQLAQSEAITFHARAHSLNDPQRKR